MCFPFNMFTDFNPVSIETDTCVTTHTPSGMPYVDTLHPRLYVAFGANGSGGKSCDEIGKMAARLVAAGRWDYDMPEEWFKFQRVKRGAKKRGLQYAKL